MSEGGISGRLSAVSSQLSALSPQPSALSGELPNTAGAAIRAVRDRPTGGVMDFLSNVSA
jgi:hypothetical protein